MLSSAKSHDNNTGEVACLSEKDRKALNRVVVTSEGREDWGTTEL